MNPGTVKFGSGKSASDGVMIHNKRGSGTAFTMLASDTHSPCVENRPNLAPGPEYRTQYFVHDEPIGLFSDVFQVTVPGYAPRCRLFYMAIEAGGHACLGLFLYHIEVASRAKHRTDIP